MGKASCGLETIQKLDFIKMEDSTFVFFSLRREIMSGKLSKKRDNEWKIYAKK